MSRRRFVGAKLKRRNASSGSTLISRRKLSAMWSRSKGAKTEHEEDASLHMAYEEDAALQAAIAESRSKEMEDLNAALAPHAKRVDPDTPADGHCLFHVLIA